MNMNRLSHALKAIFTVNVEIKTAAGLWIWNVFVSLYLSWREAAVKFGVWFESHWMFRRRINSSLSDWRLLPYKVFLLLSLSFYSRVFRLRLQLSLCVCVFINPEAFVTRVLLSSPLSGDCSCFMSGPCCFFCWSSQFHCSCEWKYRNEERSGNIPALNIILLLFCFSFRFISSSNDAGDVWSVVSLLH